MKSSWIKCVCIMLLGCFLLSSVGYASESTVSSTESAQMIQNYVDAINDREWQRIVEMYHPEKQGQWDGWYQNEGLKYKIERNIINASLVEIVEVEWADVAEISSEIYDVYQESYDSILIYIVGMDLEVYQQNNFWYDGVNYRIFVFDTSDDEFYLDNVFLLNNPLDYTNRGYSFSDHMSNYIMIWDARGQGRFINEDGEEYTLPGFDDEPEMQARVSNGPGGAPSDSYTVTWRAYSDGYYQGDPVYISFYNLGLICAVGESEYSSLDGDSRQAITIAIRTFIYYNILYPASNGVEINSTELKVRDITWTVDFIAQNYARVKYDYDTVKNVWMYNSNDRVFNAQQRTGSWDSTGIRDMDGDGDIDNDDRVASGILYHRGCKYLLDNGIVRNKYEILHYYYGLTVRSPGVLHFYNSAGTLLPYSMNEIQIY